MTTLARDKARACEAGVAPVFNHIPVVASDIIYAGAAVGLSSGNARPLSGGDVFQGFAEEMVDNSLGAAGAKKVKVRQEGIVELSVTGVSAITNKDATVYATDDDTFTLSSTGGSSIGKIVRWISGTKCMVKFQAACLRSI